MRFEIDKYRNADLSILTVRQREFLESALRGIPQYEIAAKNNCSRQNVHIVINSACDRLDGKIKKKRKVRKIVQKEKPAISPKGINYQAYAGKDMSVLTEYQRQIFQMRLSGMKNVEIAKKIGTSQNTVGSILQKAREKLDGKVTYSQRYYIANKEKITEKKMNNPDIKNKQKEYYQKNREKLLSDKKVYNKEYYQKNRERILKKQKEKQD